MKEIIKSFLRKFFFVLDNNRLLVTEFRTEFDNIKIIIDKSGDALLEVDNLVREVDHFMPRKDVHVILDIGSRDAEVAIAFKRYFPESKVYAFECNPASIAVCKQKIAGQNDIELIEKAVMDFTGKTEFYPVNLEKSKSKNIGGSSVFTIKPEYDHDQLCQDKIFVECLSLKDWQDAAKVDDIDIIWMDVQGAELKVLKGLGAHINKVKFIYTEVAFEEIYVNQPLFEEVDKYLRDNDFRLHRRMFTSPAGWGNLLYINNSFK